MGLDFNFTTLTPDERLIEAHNIAEIIFNYCEPDDLAENERNIVVTFYKKLSTTCSPAQLNWLRRIKDKYL